VATDTVTGSLAAALGEQVDRHGVPGAAAGVLVGGEVHTACVGVTNVEHPLPVTDTTLFQVASITKTFVSTAVLLLAEDGRLSLDDPVAKHLPDLAARTGLDTDAITVEHLLSHQAGFDGDHLFVGRVPDSLDQLATARRLFEPGTGVSYNNAAVSIAGEVITAASGEPFERFITERLLQPLEIRGYFTADDCITHRVAAPHFVHGERTMVLRGTGWQPGWELGPVDRAAGGLITSVEGLLKWARFHLGDGGGLQSQESLERMHTPVVHLDRFIGIGLDWFVQGRAADHGGLTVGYCSTLVLVPDADVAVVCLTHATNGGAVNQAIRRWALAEHAGIVERDPDPDPSVEIDASRFEGRFLSPFAQLTIAAGERPNTLLVTSSQREDVEGWKPPPPPPMTMAFVDDRHAVTLDAPGPQAWSQFGFGDDGRVEWLTWNSRRAVRND
jgi:CubicO group peptidase (beta-lactamase class C family)